MIRSLALATIAISVLAPPSAVADDKADAEFASLYEEAWRDPAKADMAKLRKAFIETSRYKPYAIESDEKAGVEKALAKEDMPAAIAAMDAVIAKKPLDVEHHAFAGFLHQKAGDKDLEAKHKAMTRALLTSMLEGHDGKSHQAAIPVLNVGEEYMLLRSMKLKSKGQALQAKDGHYFDVHTILDPETGKERPIYFNIDAPHAAMRKMLKPSPEKGR